MNIMNEKMNILFCLHSLVPNHPQPWTSPLGHRQEATNRFSPPAHTHNLFVLWCTRHFSVSSCLSLSQLIGSICMRSRSAVKYIKFSHIRLLGIATMAFPANVYSVYMSRKSMDVYDGRAYNYSKSTSCM